MKIDLSKLQIILGITGIASAVCACVVLFLMGYKPNQISVDIGPVGIDFATPNGRPSLPSIKLPSPVTPSSVVNPPVIINAHMSTDETDTASTKIYSTNIPNFYCYFDLKNAPSDTVVKGTWTLVSAEGYDPNQEIDSAEITGGDNNYYFSLGGGEGLWPVGQYKIDLYLNDELVQTVNFDVK